MKRFLTIALLVVAGLSVSCKKTTVKTVEPGYVTSYIRTWPLSTGKHWTADQIKSEYLSHLIISFARIDAGDKYSLYMPDAQVGIWDEVAKVKARCPKLEVTFSVGGWGGEFSDTMADPELMAKFVANVVDWLDKYKLDGVDIDWEYPVGPDWGLEIKTRPEDRENYITLLTSLRTELDKLGQKNGGKHYSLSTAVPASGWFVEKNDVVAASSLVDSFKLMSYDYYGSWNQTTGHHANLSNNPADPAWGGWSTKQAVDVYLNAGVPANKIILGVAFYGQAWAGVPENGTNGLFQEGKGLNADNYSYSPAIEKLLQPDSGYRRFWDEVAEAPYLYNGDVWVSYSDEQEFALIGTYVKEKGLGGVMVWEYGHDINAKLLKALNEVVK